MYLKAIELQGFKSFPDKTRVTFDKGMTAVVGPNGSGKSNISDAIRWVLGETSGKELRATGKMEDIIFGGTSHRGPMGFASVSLILDNTDKSFNMDSDEIAVTRKYYRGGEGEYFINSNRVRLKDIYELFLDTGLGKSGYSIVGQGKIAQIVTAKPENRREIFEEASGIAKFRYKKNEAEKKLVGAQENMLRLTDILVNLEERVGPLEQESKKAKEFVELAAKKKEMEISWWISTVDRSKSLTREQQRKMEIFQSDYDQLDTQITEKEAYIEKRYFESNSLITKSEENIAAIRNIEQTIGQENAQKAVLESQQTYNGQKLQELTQELESFDLQGSGYEKQKQTFLQQKQELEVKNQQLVLTQKQTQEELITLTDTAKQADAQKGALLEQENKLKQDIQDCKMNMHGLETQNVSVYETLTKTTQELEKSTQYHQVVKGQVDELQSFLHQVNDTVDKTNNIKNGLGLKLNSVQERLAKITEKQNQNISRKMEIENKIRLLKDMENNLDGFQQSVKTILNLGKNGGLPGIEGTIAQLITVEKGYETAVEIALGYALQNVVVANETSAKQAIEYLKSQKSGRATFLPLDTVKPSNFNEQLPTWATTADKVITAKEKYKGVISSLLGRTIIVEDINSASRLAKQLNYRFKIVTLDGQQVNAGGSFTGGSLNKSAGLFTRKSEIIKLEKTLQDVLQECTQIEEEYAKVRESQDLISSQIEGCLAEIQGHLQDKTNCEIELAKESQSLLQYENALKLHQEIIDNCTQVLQENKERFATMEGQIQENQGALQQVMTALENLGTMDDQAHVKQQQLNDQLQEIKLEIVQTQGQISLIDNNLSQLSLQDEMRFERKAKLEQDITTITAENTSKEQEVMAIITKIEQLHVQIKEIEEQNKTFVATRLEIEQERNEITLQARGLQNQKEDLSKQIAKITEKIIGMETAYDEIIQKLWEEYELTVETARPFAVSFDDEIQLKKELAAVKNAIKRLGNVNVGAIEEYKEVYEKYTFLKEQLKDLEDSRQQLIKLIASLNGEMKTMFAESFTVINRNFEKIFKELFGGGSATLCLTDPENILESGVDIQVSPPGKVIKSLTALSGGEQALVAISIYFAILAHNPSPFCILDEIEAALDDANVTRYANYLHSISGTTQFIVITHRRGTMEAADVLYGVTMQEDGISKLLKLDVNNISPSLIG